MKNEKVNKSTPLISTQPLEKRPKIDKRTPTFIPESRVVNVKTMTTIAHIFLAFSEKLNFKSEISDFSLTPTNGRWR